MDVRRHGGVGAMGGRPSVLIVGGGLAGLAAASVLAPAGFRVTLVEGRGKLGGRAGSFRDAATGDVVDNCQHVSMGCCTNLADFCRRVGIDDLFESHETLHFMDEQGRVSRMRASRLPAPFHLAPSLVAARFLTLKEKGLVARGLAALMRQAAPPQDASFLEWLRAHGQTERTIVRFWGVVLVSALNETLDRIDWFHARQVFVEGFLRNREGWRVEIPRVALDELYGRRLEAWLAERGAHVELSAPAVALAMDRGRATGCVLRDGRRIEADETILAVGFHRAVALLPREALELDPQLERIGLLEASPITSVHLWYDRPVMDWPHLVVVGRTVQWLFRRAGEGGGGYVQAVISASRALASQGNDEIERRVVADAAAMLPRAREASLVHSRVVTERRATFSVAPGVDRLRPDFRTRVPGLWLAGDYVRTGWPATMEGAVRSGYLAAEALLERAGSPASVVQAPPPASLLSRRLVR
jgi:squalene-associated FAD-dependent desaturase